MTSRAWLRGSALLVGAAALYCALLCYPDPLFAHSVREGTVVLHSPVPLPSLAHRIAREADTRIARSPLYDPSVMHHVYLCDTRWRFALLSMHRYRAVGVAYGGLTQNVFVRPSDIIRDRVLRHDGSEVPADRTLSYFITHEIVHGMLSGALGRLGYLRLSTWQNEGYADYVAKAGAFDYAYELRRFHDGARELDPTRSGLYLRYQLTVSFWLDQRKLSVRQMLALPESAGALPD